MNEERITYDEFMIMFKFAPKMCYTLYDKAEDEIDRLNNIINELENTIANFIDNHTESYIDWKYDREIYLAESNILQKLCDTYFDKLKELRDGD